MSIKFSGKVIRGARVSPVNAATTGEATVGVTRLISKPYESAFDYENLPYLLDATADQYRVAVLDAPGTTPVEYLVWVANSGKLAYHTDDDWRIDTGTSTVIPNNLTVGIYTDGSLTVEVTDDEYRLIDYIYSITVRRGDTFASVTIVNSSPTANTLKITEPADIIALGGGISIARGDSITQVEYVLAPATFWWSRNDRYQTRFGWSNVTQRWEPFKGGSPKNMGALMLDTKYQMSPRISNLPLGVYLTGNGNPAFPDFFSVFRLGTSPSASNSIGIGNEGGYGSYKGIQVRTDAELDSDFNFGPYPELSGVMGQFNGKLQFNPAYVKLHAGKTLWYYYRNFEKDSDGIVGSILGADSLPLFLSPLPDPMGRPLIRFGNRKYLDVQLVINDQALLNTTTISGSVVVSMTTGQLRFNSEDIAKADPSSALFDKQYLSNDVIYDGVALNSVPQPIRPSVIVTNVIDADSPMYLSNASYLPTNDFKDFFQGLGVSGVMEVPDGTGSIPSGYDAFTTDYYTASVRPKGDEVLTPDNINTGMIRQIEDGVGDTIFFTRRNAFTNLHVVGFEGLVNEFPPMDSIPFGDVYVAKNNQGVLGNYLGSQVEIGSEARKQLEGERLYFVQASLTPSFSMFYPPTREKPKLYSRNRDIFRFKYGASAAECDTLYVGLFDGSNFIVVTWSSYALWNGVPWKPFYTADEVKTSFDLTQWLCTVENGYLVLSPTVQREYIAIGILWNNLSTDPVDLSGATALGFVPGWWAATDPVYTCYSWLPDSGISFGFFRNPANLDSTLSTPDVQCEGKIDNEIIQESVSGVPYFFLTQIPLQDLPGTDYGVYFSQTITAYQEDDVQIIQKPLIQCEDVLYRFEQKKFDWVEKSTLIGKIEQATSSISFGKSAVATESFYGNPDISTGLYISEDGGANQFEVLDTDFILPQDGIPGTALLTETYGTLVTFGAQGEVTEGSNTFIDPSVNFLDADNPILVGYRIDIDTIGINGSYIVTSVGSEHQLQLDLAIASTPDTPVVWKAYTGYPVSVYDPSLVADIIYKDFNHLQTEPFKVRVLSLVGLVPVSETTPSLKANVANAIASGRNINIRYGLVAATASNTAEMVALLKTVLGTIANGSLVIPNTDSTRFASGSFSLQLGAVAFTHASGKLVGVTAFSADPVGHIEYLTTQFDIYTTGTLKFGSQLLALYESADVLYVEEFQPSADVPALTVEYNPITGYLNFSQTDMDVFSGTKAYFVEQMITEGRKDVAISPLLGAFSFSTPVPTGSTVEVEYWMADLSGAKVEPQITEFLPVFVRSEQAVKTGANTYTFNVAKRTVDQRIEPIVTVGAVQQNFGRTDFVVSYPPELNGMGRISFTSQVFADYIPIVVNYAVWEALGGERGYESSLKPVYRPPFFITAGQKRFGLRGDRSNEFVAGQMLRIGVDCFYIQKTQYYPYDGTSQSNITGIYIYPPTVNEVGSRAPGNDILTVVSAQPVTTQVPNPDDPLNPITTTAPAGFMSSIDLTVFPFQPVSIGQRNIVFQGNLTQFAVPGHILEIANYPFSIAESKLSDDGMYTSISVTSVFQQNFTVADNPTIKLSYRPIYPPAPREFIGCGPILDTEPVTLTLYSAGIPGRALIPNVEFSLNYGTGYIKLLEPLQEALQPYQRLVLSFTKLKTLQPFIQNGAVICPRISAEFLNGIIPNVLNGLLGSTVSATYYYRNPDTFYAAIPTMKEYAGEVAQQAIKEMQASNASNGPIKTSESTKNWDQGRTGLKSQRQDLCDKDWAARRMLNFYNSNILYFEQIEETITGRYIGDRDGKFRFWIGTGLQYPAPGYEDDISGNLITRNLYSEVFSSQPGIWFTYLTTDPLIDPSTADLNDKLTYQPSLIPVYVRNITISSNLLESLIFDQETLIRNDIDDLVLTNAGFPQLEIIPFNNTHVTNLIMMGEYHYMFESQRFSRLFPTQTESFSMTYPGIGAVPPSNVGIYTAGRMINGSLCVTTGKPIGQLKNPVLGDIKNVSSADLSQRRARARIWGYFPNGIGAGAFYTDVTPTDPPTPSPAINEPCLIAFPCNLEEVPINFDTGFPDQYRLISQSANGETPDAENGDPLMFVPGFTIGSELSWGQPDGLVYPAVSRQLADLRYMGLFVKQVQYGCVITFKNDSGTSVATPAEVRVSIADTVSTQADLFPIVQGDTIFEAVPILQDIASPTIEQQAGVLPKYRNGFDLLVQSDGKIIDTTFPSKYDSNPENPFASKENMGQNPPLPMSYIGGGVNFFYDSAMPLNIPALSGSDKDDSGDYQIPYMATGISEYECLSTMPEFLSIPGMWTGLWFPIEDYPEEILANDGFVIATYNPLVPSHKPATLMTTINVEPTAPHKKGASRYDLLFVQSEDPSKFEAGVPIRGPQGIWTIGDVSYDAVGGVSLVEPPRFITATNPPIAEPSPSTGSPVGYTINNAMVFVDGEHASDDGHPQSHLPLSGVKLICYPNLPQPITILDFTSVPNFSLNDGVTAGVGNLNNIYSADTNNIIKVKLIARWDDDIVNYPPPPVAPPYPWQQPGGEVVLTITIVGDGNVIVEDWAGRFYSGVVANPVQFGVSYPAVVLPVNNKQIIMDATFPIWGVATPPANAWFLPYAVTGAGPTEKWETLYGFEYSFDLETVVSDTAWIDDDRLTFHETIDLRHAKERGYVHPANPSLSLETELVVDTVTVGYNTATLSTSTVNRWVNGTFSPPFNFPVPFTFKPRTAVFNHSAGGDWTAQTPTDAEKGSLKVMAFEGYGNTEITAANAKFSVAPSVLYRDGNVICDGTGETESYFCPTPQWRNLDNSLQNLVIGSGSVSSIESGDVVVIRESADPANQASTKVGSYIVRHAVQADPWLNYHLCIRATITDTGADWCPVHFPTIISATVISPTQVDIVLSDLAPVFGGNGFAVGERLYVLRGNDFSSNTQIEDSIESGEITAIDDITNTISVKDFEDGIEGAMTAATFAANALDGLKVSGMTYLPVNIACDDYYPADYDANLPPNNCVGYHNPVNGAAVIFGFDQITITRTVGQTFNAYADPIPPPPIPPPPVNSICIPTSVDSGCIGVVALEAELGEHNFSFDFKPNPRDPIYSLVPYAIEISKLTDTQWQNINTSAILQAVRCILPATTMTCAFKAKEGIFLEPSMPRTGMDLDNTFPLVVYNGHSLPDPAIAATDYERYIGMRSASAYDVGLSTATYPEKVAFEVRSIRRFHEILEAGLSEMEPLRYVYEIRRGLMTSCTTDAGTQVSTVVADGFTMNWLPFAGYPKPADVWYDGTGPHYGTNLGTFTSADVNVKAGDTFRRLDASGRLLEERTIKEIVGASTIILNPPEMATLTNDTSRFEIYLQNAPVPHEQSNEQLLGMITNKEVLQSNADYATLKGGYVKDIVYADDVNKLYDDLQTETFTTLGVQAGDIVIVDPAGKLPTPTTVIPTPYLPESGAYPIGNQSVATRILPPDLYEAGHPRPLDDNRGYYRVLSVVSTPEVYLNVSPISTFTGPALIPVVFGGSGTEYVVYPAISDSLLSPVAQEAQMDLRPTKGWDVVNGTYVNLGYSVRPFSYRIIRPTKMFTDQAIDVVLSTRERMLTWIEMVKVFLLGWKSGSYFIFQRDKHIENLGYLYNPELGFGVPSDELLEDMLGLVWNTPYANNSGCMSMLDRRFWIGDERLDLLTTDLADTTKMTICVPPAIPYTNFTANPSNMRPILIDWINSILDKKDKFRQTRYIWTNYRTNKVYGTLSRIQQYDIDLPKKLAEQQAIATVTATVERFLDEE